MAINGHLVVPNQSQEQLVLELMDTSTRSQQSMKMMTFGFLESEIENLLIQNGAEYFYGAFGLFRIWNLQ